MIIILIIIVMIQLTNTITMIIIKIQVTKTTITIIMIILTIMPGTTSTATNSTGRPLRTRSWAPVTRVRGPTLSSTRGMDRGARGTHWGARGAPWEFRGIRLEVRGATWTTRPIHTILTITRLHRISSSTPQSRFILVKTLIILIFHIISGIR